MFKGSFVALVTPFNGGKVDEAAYAGLINWHIENGTNGFVPTGTTGESATLTYEEHHKVVELCVKYVNNRAPVIAGTGSNSTAEALELTRAASASGADAALVLTPYYNKPTQEGLYRHYMTIAEGAEIPLFVYDVPGRTAVEIAPGTLARVAAHERIIGLKDACAKLTKTAEVIALCGPEFTVLSGDDGLTLPMMAIGARGVISVTANVAPAEVAAMTGAALAGDYSRARELHYLLREINETLFIETNPIPVKTALAIMGRIREEFRLPLCEMAQMNREKLTAVMRRLGVIE